jgi:hypothetical protein
MPKRTPKCEPTPPDLTRCEALKPNGHTFMTFGGVPGLVRCSKKPTLLAREAKPPKGETTRGAMSLCTECARVAEKQLGIAVTFHPLPETVDAK